jgi:hypothetical protein
MPKPVFKHDDEHPPCASCGFPCSPRTDGAMVCINRKCSYGRAYLDERKAAEDAVTLVQAENAMKVLRTLKYYPGCRDDLETTLKDFIADAMHACDVFDLDFTDLLRQASNYYADEQDPDEAAVEAQFIGMSKAELRKLAKDGCRMESCPKCGTAVRRALAYVDEGEGPEAGRTFYYCSEHCRETH